MNMLWAKHESNWDMAVQTVGWAQSITEHSVLTTCHSNSTPRLNNSTHCPNPLRRNFTQSPSLFLACFLQLASRMPPNLGHPSTIPLAPSWISLLFLLASLSGQGHLLSLIHILLWWFQQSQHKLIAPEWCRFSTWASPLKPKVPCALLTWPLSNIYWSSQTQHIWK